MRVATLFLVVVLWGALTTCFAAAAPSPSDDAVAFANTGSRPLGIRGRVMGGTVVTSEAKYPWMVSLRFKHDPTKPPVHFCGGAVVAPSLVVTAAHCVDKLLGREDALSIWYGSNNLGRGGQFVPVIKIIVHPDKRVVKIPLSDGQFHEVYDNDVALLRVSAKMSASLAIRLLAPGQEARLFGDGALVTVAGWGLTENGQPASTLRHVGLKTVPRTICNRPESYGGYISNNMTCAGFAEGQKDSCQGDSGGPLMAYDQQGGMLLAGIVSWGEGCALPNKYGVYARVPRHFDWLMQAIQMSQ
jgi:secreted trypsin-like serine protease